MSVMLLFPLMIVAVLIILLVVAVIAIASRSRKSERPSVAPSYQTAEGPSRAERQAILERLARGEIGKEEAENELGRFGSPVPGDMPRTMSRPSTNKGCLIALIIAILIPLIVLPLLFFGHWSSVRSMRRKEGSRAQESRLMEQHRTTSRGMERSRVTGQGVEVRMESNNQRQAENHR